MHGQAIATSPYQGNSISAMHVGWDKNQSERSFAWVHGESTVKRRNASYLILFPSHPLKAFVRASARLHRPPANHATHAALPATLPSLDLLHCRVVILGKVTIFGTDSTLISLRTHASSSSAAAPVSPMLKRTNRATLMFSPSLPTYDLTNSSTDMFGSRM